MPRLEAQAELRSHAEKIEILELEAATVFLPPLRPNEKPGLNVHTSCVVTSTSTTPS